MNKRRYNSEKAKRDIIEKATLIFSQKGYNQASVQEISKASGYSKGHIYYHFENKEKLFVLLAQNTMQDWYTKWAVKESSYSTATEKLYGIGKHVLYNYQTPLLKGGQELASNPASSLESIKALHDLAVIPMGVYRAILQEGVENGEFEEGNINEWTILIGTWLGGLCQLTNTQDLHSLEPLFIQAVTIFLASIKRRI
ncbi:TetR family transcriptional regulator C-terminal domain-containing protein [Solibacillus merdavium]|uniref:TetR family transcriptional regulator n=1 Tax=Solibacillus merdavium TaxID=2762218 RepID=A0ABR8XJV1_9BACL|nr:TetR/AcrR family transcriptional regulator [Solibacillus merdavium]MBD8032215.1 TetR family transcriptional regulator [Solibacillus merdavium]